MPSLTGEGAPEAGLGSANERAGAAVQAAAINALEQRNLRREEFDLIAYLYAAEGNKAEVFGFPPSRQQKVARMGHGEVSGYEHH